MKSKYVPALSPVQWKHLDELVDRGPYWYPHGSSEYRSARALARKGMVIHSYLGTQSVYTLTECGRFSVLAKRAFNDWSADGR